MKETRDKEIKSRVFTKNDIRSLWANLNKEDQSSKSKKDHSSIDLTLNSTDGTGYESNTSELLSDGDIIDLKKSTSISLDYYNYRLGRRIIITLQHGDYGSRIVVSGKDRDWVAGVFDRLNAVLDAVKPQKSWLILHKTLLLHLIALGVGFTIYTVVDFLLLRHITPLENPSKKILVIREFFKQNPFSITLLDFFLFWLNGIFPALWLREWVLKLWPSVEFDFGPENQKIEKLKRFRIRLVLTLIIIPFLVNLIYELVNNYWS